MYHAKSHNGRRAIRTERGGYDGDRPWRPKPGELRRLVIVIDFDFGRWRIFTMGLYATRRIDLYRVKIKGKTRFARMGWSGVCRHLRMSFPRVGAS